MAIVAIAPRAFAMQNPATCTNPSVTIRINEFLDNNGNHVFDGGDVGPLPSGTVKDEGANIIYQATVAHAGSDNCGFEGGTICIDLPGVGCPASNPAVAAPSFTTVGPGECCDVTPAGGVPLVCDPLVCVPPGVAELKSRFVPYTVSAVDVGRAGCPPQQIRAVSYYDEGFSKQQAGAVDVFPANASIPICNPVGNVGFPHFMCYEVDDRPFPDMTGPITVEDQFGVGSAPVGRFKRICNPADKIVGLETFPGRGFPDHLAEYEYDPESFDTSGGLGRLPVTVRVNNQFGEFLLEVVKPDRIMIPSGKTLDGTFRGPVGAIDHFQCFTVRGGAFLLPGVRVVDQFTTGLPLGQLLVNVKSPVRLCAPADKNDEGFVDPDGKEGTHLLCYDVRTEPKGNFFRQDIFVKNQVDEHEINVTGPRELCLPSTKSLP
jgi:hypothetical protein